MGIFALVKVAASALAAFVLALASFVMGLGAQTVSVTTLPGVQAPATFPQATSSTEISSSGSSSAPTTSSVAVKPQPVLPPPSATPQAIAPPVLQLSSEELNTLARASLVNILCTTRGGGSFNPISGSGVIVDSRGIILTNAHVAQYFLLRDYPAPGNVECVVRTGSPAQPRYIARLLYLPPAWIAVNAPKIKDAAPTGTGENDYAFLLITGAVNPQNPLPSSYPALPMSSRDPSTGEAMLVAGYPAGFLGGIAISTSLYSSAAMTAVGQLYTFNDKTLVDLFSLGGTVVSQSGSSGGAAVSTDGKLRGVIVTELLADTTEGRDLRALSLAHIDRSLKAAGEGGIVTLLSKDAEKISADFNAKVAPAETQALVEALTK